MQKFVIINLAEPGDLGPVSSAQAAMQLRMVNQLGEALTSDEVKLRRLKMEVPVHRLLEALRAIRDGRPADTEEDLVLARDDCQDADKIIVCTHGMPDDVDHFFSAGRKQLGNAAELADFIKRLLDPNRVHHVSLAMCYGARTQSWLPRDLDAQGPIGPDELASSFAYKFFKAMHAQPNARRLVMTARTGATGYRGSDGRSEVEQEAALALRLLIQEYGRKARDTHWRDDIAQAERRGTPKSRKRAFRFKKIDEHFRQRPGRIAFKSVDRKARRYHSYLKKRKAAEIERLAYPELTKYGKIVYRRQPDGELRITRKYTDGVTTHTVLYQGQWL